MRRVSIVVLSLVCAGAFGQGLRTVSYSAKQQAPPPPTLRATANLVVVDVVVRDKAGHAIKGLKQDDFVLTEDKAAQRINHFEEHTSAEIVPSSAALPKLPAGVFTNFTPVPAQGPLNILVFDKFNTQPHDQANLRLQLLKFIDEAKPGTRMALFELGQHLRLLQGFTEDRELLRTALRDRNVTLLAPFNYNSDDLSSSLPACVPERAEQGKCFEGCDVNALVKRGEAIVHDETICTQVYARSAAMQSTLEFLALYLGNLSGRKNVMWFSAKFPFTFFSDQLDGVGHVSIEEFRRSVDKLRTAHVAIYPMGIHIPTDFDMKAIGPPTDDMNELARETGGRAFNNPASIDEDTVAAMDDGSNYYTLTYAPADPNWNGSYRNITVRLANGGNAELSYRRGYYADDPNKPVKSTIFGKATLPKREARPEAMQMALMLGVPEVSGVSFVARVLPGGVATERSLADGNEGSKGLIGPYQRYTVRLAIDPRTLQLTESPDGSRHGTLEYVTFVYDLKGNVINSVGRTAKVDLKPDVYAGVLRGGLPVEAEISAPAKGDYTFRIAVHDLSDDHVGAVEVPTSAVRNLAAK